MFVVGLVGFGFAGVVCQGGYFMVLMTSTTSSTRYSDSSFHLEELSEFTVTTIGGLVESTTM